MQQEAFGANLLHGPLRSKLVDHVSSKQSEQPALVDLQSAFGDLVLGDLLRDKK